MWNIYFNYDPIGYIGNIAVYNTASTYILYDEYSGNFKVIRKA